MLLVMRAYRPHVHLGLSAPETVRIRIDVRNLKEVSETCLEAKSH